MFKGGRGKGKCKTSKKPKNNQQEKVSMKKDKLTRKCFNCGNKGYFANECFKPKKVNVHTTHMCVKNMLSNALLIESSLLWIDDSGATNHITNSIDEFMDFRRVLRKSK